MNIWDQQRKEWKTKGGLIEQYNLSSSHVDVVGKRTQVWCKDDLWLMPIGDGQQLKAFEWEGQQPVWLLPKVDDSPQIHCILNEKWKVLRDKSQCYTT